MLYVTLIILAIAAGAGLVLATHVWRGRPAPWPLSIGHGLLGALALVLLLVMLVQGGAAVRVWIGLLLLLLAAAGGFYLASLHLRENVAPRSALMIHGLLAALGFLVLLSLVL
ncbi:MAG TPA: hypothetical protein VK110_01430 [Salinisphaeraceae bacterium]|nr:hypothetical protein [Salinisphaeraceae bacterium]